MDFSSFIESPIYQALAFLVINILLLPVSRSSSADRAYTVSGLIYVVFIATNVILCFWATTTWTYFLWSLGATLGLMYGLYVSANAFLKHIVKNDDSGESSMIFLVVMYHPPALLLAMFLKWLF